MAAAATTCDAAAAALATYSSATCVLFSAYVEGLSYNKLLDITNRCPSASITLSDYELVNCGNGCTHWEHTTPLTLPTPTPQLAPGGTWRLADPQIAILPSGDPAYAYDQTKSFLSNGNDLYGLKHVPTGAVVDVIGGPVFPGSSVPTGWDVGGISKATKDHSLVRKPTVLHGNCGDWAMSAGTNTSNSEWLIYPVDTVMSKDGATTATPITSSGSGGSSGGGGTPPPPSPSPPPPGGGSTGGGGDSGSCPSGMLPDCPAPPAFPTLDADRRPDKSKLTIASWNAEWLFDGVCDPSFSPWNGGNGCVGYHSGLNQCDAAGAALKIQRAAEVIGRMKADVINLVEVEGCDELNACAAAVNNSALLGTGSHPYEAYLLTGTDTYLKQQVGLLTRLTPSQPLMRTTLHEDYPIDSASQCGAGQSPGSTGISKHYLARLMIEGLAAPGSNSLYGTLAVLGIHFKAIPTQTYACHKREAQAKVAQSLLVTALSETPYVVAMGDFNDFDKDACCLDAADSMPTSRVLRMLKDPYNTGEDALHSVAANLSKAERYSDWWDHAPSNNVDDGLAEHSMLDHMLVSTALYNKLTEVRIDHTHAPMDTQLDVRQAFADHSSISIELVQLTVTEATRRRSRQLQSGGGVNLDLQITAANPLAIINDINKNLADASDMANLIQNAVTDPSITVAVTAVELVTTESHVLSSEDLALLPADFVAGLKPPSPPPSSSSLLLYVGLGAVVAALVAIGCLWQRRGRSKPRGRTRTFDSAMSSSSSVTSAAGGGEWELNDAAISASNMDKSKAEPEAVPA